MLLGKTLSLITNGEEAFQSGRYIEKNTNTLDAI